MFLVTAVYECDTAVYECDTAVYECDTAVYECEYVCALPFIASVPAANRTLKIFIGSCQPQFGILPWYPPFHAMCQMLLCSGQN